MGHGTWTSSTSIRLVFYTLSLCFILLRHFQAEVKPQSRLRPRTFGLTLLLKTSKRQTLTETRFRWILGPTSAGGTPSLLACRAEAKGVVFPVRLAAALALEDRCELMGL